MVQGAITQAGWRSALFLFAGLCALALGLPRVAAGAASSEAGRLLSAPCPEYRVVHPQPHSAADMAASARWRFNILGKEKRLKPPINWGNSSFPSGTRRRWLQKVDWLDVLFYRYTVNGDVGALAQARDIVLDWARADRGGRQGSDAWLNKVAGDRAGYFGYLARAAACRGLLTRKSATSLIGTLRKHGAFLANPRNYSTSNHGLFVDNALVLLAYYLPFDSRASKWNRLGQHRFVTNLKRNLSPSDTWLEQSIGYHFLVTSLVRQFADLVPPGQRQAELADLKTRMETIGRWFVMPDGKPPQFGDTGPVARCWAMQPATCPASPDTFPSGLMPTTDAGYAVIKDPPGHAGSYLAMTDGYFRTPHKHADDTSFDLFDSGHRIVSDTGKPAGDAGKSFRFARSDAAHSLLTADGGFGPPPRTFGSGILATGAGGVGWYGIDAQNRSLAKRGISEQRVLLYLPGKALIVVDRASSKRKHRYTRYLQLGQDIGLSSLGGNGFGLSAPGFSGRLYDAPPVGGGGVSAFAVRGRRRPLQGFLWDDLFHAVPRWTVGLTARAKRATYVTTISLSGDFYRAQLESAGSSSFALQVIPGVLPAYTLTASRSGGTLAISQTP
jgi:hypothetical protein